MMIPTEQQQSMKRFLTPSRNESFHTIDNNQQSVQKLQGKYIIKDESKEKIANFRQLSNLREKKAGSGVKLPQIRSMSINTSYKYLNKNQSMKPGANINALGLSPFNQSPPIGSVGTNQYHAGQEKLKNAVNFNATIKEVTGEQFFTKYGAD